MISSASATGGDGGAGNFSAPPPGAGLPAPAARRPQDREEQNCSRPRPGAPGGSKQCLCSRKHGRGRAFDGGFNRAPWGRGDGQRDRNRRRARRWKLAPRSSGRRERDLDRDHRSRRAGSSAVDRNRIRHKPKRRSSVRRSIHSKDQLCRSERYVDSGGVIVLQRRHSDDQCDRARRLRSGPRQPRPDRLYQRLCWLTYTGIPELGRC